MRFSFVVSGGLGYHIPDLFENDSSFMEFEKALEILRKYGFTGVELNLSFDEKKLLSRIADSIRQQGLRLASVGTGLIYLRRGFSFTNPDSTKRDKAIAIVNELIRFASGEHAIVVIGVVRGTSGEVDASKLLRKSLVECDKTASEYKVRLALEAINRYETSLLNTATEVVEVIQDEGLTATGLLLDSFHMNIEEISIEATIRKYCSRIAHFHIADSNRWPPGCGHLKVEGQLRLLEQLGYDGWVSAETLPKPDNAEAVKETARFLTMHSFNQS
jgi:sugar phosphate isomerase/epimerase